VKAKQFIRRMQVPATLVLCGLCAAVPLAAAELNSRAIPDVHVWDEANHNVPLQSVLTTAGGGPVILLPIYTRCAASCPVLTRKLEGETARMGSGIAYRVLVFSFDPSETSESLQIFRRQERVPANWVMVRTDEGEIRQFFDFFHYSIMTEGDMLIHPSEIFLLDHDLNWRATLVGADWSSAELQKQLSRIETPSLTGWIAMNPAALAVMGFGGMLLSLGLLIGWLIFRKPPKQQVAA
jgi:cytochrome oxidase Cu insertion factor (SCO1/SenC/PrrC family)